MYGQSGVRGIVRTRALSFSLYLLALALGIVTIPLVLLGPSLLGEILPEGWTWLIVLYWPLVTLLTVGGLTSLYHISTPRRSPWLRDAPGAVVDHGAVDRRLLRRPRHDRRVAGRRHARSTGRCRPPIVLLIWLYTLAIAVLIGAAANASIRELYPHEEQRSLHERLARVGRGPAAAPHRAARAPGRLGRPVRRLRPGDADDDLGLSGLREAAAGRSPRCPVPGEGRDRVRARRRGRPPGRRRALRRGPPVRRVQPVWISSRRSDNVCEHAKRGSRATARADVAQLVERNLAKVEVAGSNPVIRSEGVAAPTVEWPRGEAAACKAAYTGSNPVSTSSSTRTAAVPHGRVAQPG